MMCSLPKPAYWLIGSYLTLMLAACGKSEGQPPQAEPDDQTAYLEMKVDGQSWSADAEINAWGAKHILLTGKKTGTEQAVSANVPYAEAAGTYPIEAETGSFFHFQKEAGVIYQITKGGGRGTVTITRREKNAEGHVMLSGTFEGTAIRFGFPDDSIRITEGRFHDVMLD